MEITEERRADVLILRVIGTLYASTSKGSGGYNPVSHSLELSWATGIDLSSSTTSAAQAYEYFFLLAAKRTDDVTGKMMLCSLKDAVKQLFDIAGISSFLNQAFDLEQNSR